MLTVLIQNVMKSGQFSDVGDEFFALFRTSFIDCILRIFVYKFCFLILFVLLMPNLWRNRSMQ